MKKILFTLVFFVSTYISFAQPSGTIVAFGGPKNKIPTGWVVCDGKSYPKTGKYKNLFDAIGTSWGGDAANKFYVPDLRGLFLRGVSEDSGNDPDTDTLHRSSSRIDLAIPGNNGNNVGSKQQDEFKSHFHVSTSEFKGRAQLLGEGNGGSLATGGKTELAGGSETRRQLYTTCYQNSLLFQNHRKN